MLILVDVQKMVPTSRIITLTMCINNFRRLQVFSLIFLLISTSAIAQRQDQTTGIVADTLAQPNPSKISISTDEFILQGYGSQRQSSLTNAISTLNGKDIEQVRGGMTTSSGLAGKIPGLSFRMPDGRPGAAAFIQIRNLGSPLYVIDGIQLDEEQFNNLSPYDIESISVLKDASAAVYGMRGANGVVLVTTRKGITGRNNVNINASTGIQEFTRFPTGLTNAYDYMRYRADSEVNRFGSTTITQADLDKYKQGAAAGDAYRSFNWKKFVLHRPSTQNNVNINLNGGSEKVNYYISASNSFQNAVLGDDFKFDRSNIQSNVSAKLARGLVVGVDLNARIETRKNPALSGDDDYYLPQLSMMQNTPIERPFANDNPIYVNDLGLHTISNYAYMNDRIAGTFKSEKRVLQTNLHAEWQIPGIKGLSLRGVYSYYVSDLLETDRENSFQVFTYNSISGTYESTGGSPNAVRSRTHANQTSSTTQAQINYLNTFGRHTIGVTVVAERLRSELQSDYVAASSNLNYLPLIYYPGLSGYANDDNAQRRLGYVGRVSYSFAGRYFLEGYARRDASSLFAPDKRVGYFPGASAGWKITEENFVKQLLGDSKILSFLKLRASYGQLGDDNYHNSPIVAPYAYLEGYNYNQGTAILDGKAVIVSTDKGSPVTNITWLKSKMADVGLDFGLFNGSLTGTIDYFHRKRSGLPGSRNNVIPFELGYTLPFENLNSDIQFGEELSLLYHKSIGKINFRVGGNISYARSKDVRSSSLPADALEQYRRGITSKYSNMEWGYVVEGQFQSVEQITSSTVDIDGKGNTTLLPGDLIYKDFNKDGKIDAYDERPIGYGAGQQPNINLGITLGLNYAGFDFSADFSGAAGYTWYQTGSARSAFENGGNLNSILTDRWHREDPLDVNSKWITGQYPANRYNVQSDHSDYSRNSSFWAHDVRQFRARTIQLGYTVQSAIIKKYLWIERARIFVNTYNLFSFDNLKKFNVDPDVVNGNAIQYPQSKSFNVGINLTF